MSNLISTSELAQRLAVHPNTILKLASTGKIPAVRLSHRLLRFDLGAVQLALGLTAAKNGLPPYTPQA